MGREAAKNPAVRAIKLSPGDPYNETGEEPKLDLANSRDNGKFGVRCHAEDVGHLEVTSGSASVRISQRIRRAGKLELWGSLLVECKEQDDGSLAVEVVVYHPDWDEPMRIASIQSNPSDEDAAEPTIRCNLQHKQL